MASLREWEIGVVVSQGNRSYRSYIFLLIRGRKKPVDAHLYVPYDRGNTGKEVIQKFMSSNHSEVAAA